MYKKKFRFLKEVYLILIAPHHDSSIEVRSEREVILMKILGIFGKEIEDNFLT